MPWSSAPALIGSSASLRPPDVNRRRRLQASGAGQSPARRSYSEISGSWSKTGAWALALVLAALLAAPAAAADKVDVVSLKNGDRITCEVTLLDRSVLSVSTDPLGKVSVHWGEVVAITSPRQFDLQLTSGLHYLGSL